MTQLGYSTIMFRMDKVTYNKDGTPRKKGSGRKKGSNSLDTTTIGQLRDAGLNDDDTIVIRITNDLELVFLPPQKRLIDQHL